MAKFILPDNSAENKKRIVAASGGYHTGNVSTSSKTDAQGFAKSVTANVPITKNAQYAGSGANVAWTQPMFFSPLHTPQNWQIASRRREIMQWSRFYYSNEPKVAAGVDFYCFTPDNFILMSDGTEKLIKDIIEGDIVVTGDGTFRKVLKTHKRYTKEDILRIKVGGFNREIKVTLGHEIPRVTQSEWIKSSLTTPSKYKKKERINKFGDVKLESIYKDANSIEIGDRLFTPMSDIGSGYKDISEDICYVLGAFLAEGSYYWYENKNNNKIPKGLRFSIHEDEINNFGKKIINILEKTYNKNISIYSQNNEKCVDIVLFDTKLSQWFYEIVGKGSKTKKISEEFINQANKEQLLAFTAGYIDGDGCFDSHHGCQIRTASDNLFSQVSFIMEKLGLSFSVFKDEPKIRKIPNNCFSKTEIYSYNIRVSRRDCEIFKNHSVFYEELKSHHTKYREFLGIDDKIYRAAISIINDFYSGYVYDLTIEGEHSYVVNRIVVHNSNFSMNGFKLECKSRKVLKFYERLVDKLDLSEKLNSISHEYFLLGDVFPFMEIECPHCHGGNRKEDGGLCNHPDGTFKSIKLMNPDYIDVKDNPIVSNPEYFLLPDEELKMLITRKEPRGAYEALPQSLIDLVSSGQPIPLSTRSISHIKHNASDYGTYGTSMLQRLFTVLAYKTKIMTANWIVAERLILPVRVVKVGDKERPATDADLQDVQNQLSAVANDPNLTIVTHHAFEYEWYGATGKIHNITQELEEVGKELLDGLMLNQAILNGEMAGYCLSADTTTLCDSGFKHYWEIDPKKDKIACYNPDTKKIEYHLPYEKVVYDYEGEMVHFNTDKIDILVTPNHRMWSAKRDSDEYKFIKAEDVKPRARFIGAVEGYEGEYQKSVQIGDEEYSIYDYLKMVGYYVSEGWIREEKRKNRKHQFTTVGICQSKTGKARSDIEDIFNSMFEKHWEEENQVCVYKPYLASYLKNNFGSGAINKHLSSFVKNLTPECLGIVLEAMVNGDGCDRKYSDRELGNKAYSTSSPQLANDFAEIAFKCGYVVKIREYNKKESKNKKYFNKTGHQYKTNHQQYVVYISKGFKGRNPTLCSKSKKYAGKEITRVSYNDKIYCFSVPYELFVTMRNGVVSVQGNTSAQVGIEVLIRRLDNWRNKLKLWVEKNIFRPVAMMQGFINEDESNEIGEAVYLYPELTWNDLQLRDKTNRIQTLMQMHDKGMVSAQTVLEEMDLDYDSEVEKIREEQIMAQSSGMVAGGQQGGGAMGGMGGMGGDMGGVGAPPDMAGEGMGGDLGMMPPGGDMGMGAPGGAPGGVPGMGAAASGDMPVIGKRGSKNKQQEEAKQAPPPKMIKLTKLEQKLFKTLMSLDEPYELFAQYEVKVPGEARPYAIDFAYPRIGVGIEADGAIWHQRPDFKQRDLNRDQNLGNIGWRILRFNEEAIDENIDMVSDVIAKHVEEASKYKKVADEHGLIIKQASSEEIWKNPQYEYCLVNGKIGCKRSNISHGKILYIGNIISE